ncbi:MAG: hypothetical protein AAGH60_15765 [Pseudomonadota bacterium]
MPRDLDRDEKTGQFLPGNSGGGRGTAIRDRISHKFLCDFHDVWANKGKNAIEHMADNDQSRFVEVAVKILPKEAMLTLDFDGMDEQQLIEIIANLASGLGFDIRVPGADESPSGAGEVTQH